jgi:hypothetical protein
MSQVPRADSASLPNYTTVPSLSPSPSSHYNCAPVPAYATIDNRWNEGDAPTPATLHSMPSSEYGKAPRFEDI